jgi:hypothetical protein
VAYETLEVRREDGSNRLYWRGARVFVEKSIRDEVDELPKGAQVEAECRYDAGAVTVVRIVKVVGAGGGKAKDLAAQAREMLGKNHPEAAAGILAGADDRMERDPSLLLLRFQARSRVATERDGAVRDFRRLLELVERGGAGVPSIQDLAIELGRGAYEVRLSCEGDYVEYLEAHRELPQLGRALAAVAPNRWTPALQVRWLQEILDADVTTARDPRLGIVCDQLAPRAGEPLVGKLLERARPLREEFDRAVAAAARERQAMLPGVEGVEAVFGVRLPVELRRAWYRARDLRWRLDGARLELLDLHERVPKHLFGLAKILADKTVPGEAAAAGRGSPILPFAGDPEEVRYLCLWLGEERRGRELPVVSVICGHDLSKVHTGEPPVIEVFAESFADAVGRASAP